MKIYTIGFTQKKAETFFGLLRQNHIERLVDIRSFPMSRKWPHFNADSLAASLPASEIEYVGIPELGGRRKPLPDSPHTAWRAEQFRGYADFMDTPDFAAA